MSFPEFERSIPTSPEQAVGASEVAKLASAVDSLWTACASNGGAVKAQIGGRLVDVEAGFYTEGQYGDGLASHPEGEGSSYLKLVCPAIRTETVFVQGSDGVWSMNDRSQHQSTDGETTVELRLAPGEMVITTVFSFDRKTDAVPLMWSDTKPLTVGECVGATEQLRAVEASILPEGSRQGGGVFRAIRAALKTWRPNKIGSKHKYLLNW